MLLHSANEEQEKASSQCNWHVSHILTLFMMSETQTTKQKMEALTATFFWLSNIDFKQTIP